MKLEFILADIDRKIAQLQQARALLTDEPVKAKRGRPAKGLSLAPAVFASAPPRHTMSVEGRARVAEAQRKRWANVKKENRKAELAAKKAEVDKAAKRGASKANGKKAAVKAVGVKKSSAPAKASKTARAVSGVKGETPAPAQASE